MICDFATDNFTDKTRCNITIFKNAATEHAHLKEDSQGPGLRIDDQMNVRYSVQPGPCLIWAVRLNWNCGGTEPWSGSPNQQTLVIPLPPIRKEKALETPKHLCKRSENLWEICICWRKSPGFHCPTAGGPQSSWSRWGWSPTRAEGQEPRRWLRWVYGVRREKVGEFGWLVVFLWRNTLNTSRYR